MQLRREMKEQRRQEEAVGRLTLSPSKVRSTLAKAASISTNPDESSSYDRLVGAATRNRSSISKSVA